MQVFELSLPTIKAAHNKINNFFYQKHLRTQYKRQVMAVRMFKHTLLL